MDIYLRNDILLCVAAVVLLAAWLWRRNDKSGEVSFWLVAKILACAFAFTSVAIFAKKILPADVIAVVPNHVDRYTAQFTYYFVSFGVIFAAIVEMVRAAAITVFLVRFKRRLRNENGSTPPSA